jgi:hypothetical protein
VGATSPSSVAVAEEAKRSFVRDANGCLREWKGILVDEHALEEVSCPDVGKALGIRLHAQEPRGHFAQLLNLGSSLE